MRRQPPDGTVSTPRWGRNAETSESRLSAGTLLGPEGSDVLVQSFRPSNPLERVLRDAFGDQGSRLRTISSHQTGSLCFYVWVWGVGSPVV